MPATLVKSCGILIKYDAQALNGLLDETRISNIARSADWILTEYNNQNSPSTFYGISTATSSQAGRIQWLLTDHLGTPRIIFDANGSLAGVKRHDYLPFGEEMAAQGLRGQTSGYSASDGIRQRFTEKERDAETRLDYFVNRYISSTQGRFTSSDPENFQARLTPTDPQSWNGYAYVGNNPLARIDPNGRGEFWEKFKNAVIWGCRCTDAEIEKKRQADEDTQVRQTVVQPFGQ
jgi:RHS repeat-associated protein